MFQRKEWPLMKLIFSSYFMVSIDLEDYLISIYKIFRILINKLYEFIFIF